MILSTAKVNVMNNKNQAREVRVLLDSASQSHFITESTCDTLQLRKEKIDLIVTGISEGNLNITHQTKVEIQSKNSNFRQTITCLVIPKITDMLPTCFLNVKDFQIPPNIKLADPTYYQPGSIDILIGASLFWELLCVGQIKEHNNPILQKTKLGWIVSGNLNNKQTESRVSTKTFLTTDQRSLHGLQ